MARRQRFDRRSFLARVAGGAIGGSALLVIGNQAAAEPPAEGRRMAIDRDPSDPARESPPEPPTPATGVSDSDSGANADPAGRGRARRRSSITDSDAGANADAAGRGRGARPSSGAAPAAPSSAPQESFIICPGNPRCPS